MTPDLVIFDKLDSSAEEVAQVKASGAKVVCLEDLGPGAGLADLTINELYAPTRNVFDHDYDGPRWAVLRPEFCGLPDYRVREKADRILVTFGGTDPSGLTERVAPLLQDYYHLRVISGGQVVSMASEMRWADLVVSSAGRTAHEAAACGVPCITIAANARESTHSHCPGILRMGLHNTLSDEQIVRTIESVMKDFDRRSEMSETARAAVDGKGLQRIVARIESLLEGL